MNDFFYGWRRKVGCASLVMALAFMALWIRCPLNIDATEIEIGASIVTLASNQNGVWFVKSDLPDGLYYPSRLRGVSHDFTLPGKRMPFSDDVFRHLGKWDWQRQQRSDWQGFHIARFTKESPISGMHLTFLVIPHWIVTVPMTALSAYLLLWNPRGPERVRPNQLRYLTESMPNTTHL